MVGKTRKLKPQERLRVMLKKKPRKLSAGDLFKTAPGDAMAAVGGAYKIVFGATKSKVTAWDAAQAAFKRLPEETQNSAPLVRFMRRLEPEEIKTWGDLGHRVKTTREALKKARQRGRPII